MTRVTAAYSVGLGWIFTAAEASPRTCTLGFALASVAWTCIATVLRWIWSCWTKLAFWAASAMLTLPGYELAAAAWAFAASSCAAANWASIAASWGLVG